MSESLKGTSENLCESPLYGEEDASNVYESVAISCNVDSSHDESYKSTPNDSTHETSTSNGDEFSEESSLHELIDDPFSVFNIDDFKKDFISIFKIPVLKLYAVNSLAHIEERKKYNKAAYNEECGKELIKKYKMWGYHTVPYRYFHGRQILGTVVNFVIMAWTFWFLPFITLFAGRGRDWKWDDLDTIGQYEIILFVSYSCVPLMMGLGVKFIIDTSKFEVLGSLHKGLQQHCNPFLQKQTEDKIHKLSTWNVYFSGFGTFVLVVLAFLANFRTMQKCDETCEPNAIKRWFINIYWFIQFLGVTAFLVIEIPTIFNMVNFVNVSSEYICGIIAGYQNDLQQLSHAKDEKTKENKQKKTKCTEKYLIHIMKEVKDHITEPSARMIFTIFYIGFVFGATSGIFFILDYWDYEPRTVFFMFIAALIGSPVLILALSQPLYAMAAQAEAWNKVKQMCKANSNMKDLSQCVEAYEPFFTWIILGTKVTTDNIYAMTSKALNILWASFILPMIVKMLGVK